MQDRFPLRGRGFAEWCQCTRLLLGWAIGTPEIWRDLFAAGATPLQAAQWTVFGDAAVGAD